LIEFTHRMMSGIALLLVVGLLVWAWRSYPRKHPVRLGATLSMVFIVTEALVGAGLVLFELVAENDTIARAVWMAAHLVNTFLLLAALTLTAWWASGGNAIQSQQLGSTGLLLLVGLIGTIILGMSGAITALGDTLFPAGSLAEGLSQDTSATAHFLIRLRLLHPTIAVMASVYLIIVAGWIASRNGLDTPRRMARMLSMILVIQLAAGFLNVYLLAPIWMQILHLFLADAVWITLILFTAVVLSRDRLAQESGFHNPNRYRLTEIHLTPVVLHHCLCC
jgi:heme A synthase